MFRLVDSIKRTHDVNESLAELSYKEKRLFAIADRFIEDTDYMLQSLRCSSAPDTRQAEITNTGTRLVELRQSAIDARACDRHNDSK